MCVRVRAYVHTCACVKCVCMYSDSLPEGVEYAMNVSERLGRSNTKEQYAFMYRSAHPHTHTHTHTHVCTRITQKLREIISVAMS